MNAALSYAQLEISMLEESRGHLERLLIIFYEMTFFFRAAVLEEVSLAIFKNPVNLM